MKYHIYEIFNEAADFLNWDQKSRDKFLKNNHKIEFEIELDGESFKAFRVQHNNQNGPYKGGIRYHPDVSIKEASALAFLMTMKTSASDLPLGGAKAGVSVDPKKLNSEQLEELSREFVRNIYKKIGPKVDIPAPDMNTNSHIMDCMVDEYEKLTGDDSKASFTGKSIKMGGSHGRLEATGQGGVYVLKKYVDSEYKSSKKLTVAVQGFGNVGSHFADILAQDDKFKIVAVSDAKSAIRMEDLNEGELNIDTLKQCKRETSVCTSYIEKHKGKGKVIEIPRDDLLHQKVDVLVLAALENAVNEDNCLNINAKILLELANGPITHQSYKHLTDNGSVIIPDLVANAGGVVVSYFEWLQNIKDESWSHDKVLDQLKDKIEKTTIDMINTSKESKKHLKPAAYINALKNLS